MKNSLCTPIQEFDQHGFCGPFPLSRMNLVEPARRAATLIQERLSQAPSSFTPTQQISQIRNRHLDLVSISQICTDSAIVGHLASILGSNLVLWRTNFFFQTTKTGNGHGWHQDQYLTLLGGNRTNVSVHLALTRATTGNCVYLVPGSHRDSSSALKAKYGLDLIPGSDRDEYGAPRYVASRELTNSVVRMALQPGEFFIFNESVLHASKITAKDPIGDLRVGLAMRVTLPSIRVLPPAFSQTLPIVHKCVMLLGEDHFHLNEMGEWPSGSAP